MRGTTWSLIVGVSFLICQVGVARYVAGHRVDGAEASAYSEHLREAQTLLSRRTTEVLKVRSGMVSHFDNLVRTEIALKRAHNELLEVPSFVPEPARAELVDQVQVLKALRKDSERVIESFKSDQAILRNSTRYLTVLAADFSLLEAGSEDERDVQIAVQRLIRAILLLQVEYSEDGLHRGGISLDRLHSLRSGETTPGASEMELVLRHAETVLRKSRAVSEHNTALASFHIEEASDSLLRAYRGYEHVARRQSDSQVLVLFLLALLSLGAGASYVIARLRRSANELEASGRDLRAAVEKQKELAELKTRFVSMTSHEFRTPLSRVVSSSEMISAYRESWGPEKVETHLARIRESAMAMTRMLDSILLIGRSEAGMLKFDPKPMNVGRFCADLVETTEQSTGSLGRVDVQIDCDESLVCDESLLRHALDNLLSNALKYSSHDTRVTLRVSQEGGQVAFEVRDHGIGIPPSDVEHLFDTFHRGTNVGKIAGTGLGLSIVKRAVDLHHGTVSVETREGEGSQFHLTIPTMKDVA